MTEKNNKFIEELDGLVKDGDSLYHSMQYDYFGDAFKKQIVKVFNNEAKASEYIEKLPVFNANYQSWYTIAQAVVKQVLPDRLSDFDSYYQYSRVRKDISSENYRIYDYLQGLKVSRGEYNIIVDRGSAIPCFEQQLNIVKAAKVALNSSLLDLKLVLQADLFDSEIESASALSKAGHKRAAGAMCGVVIEKHLKEVCGLHNIKVSKKNPGISDLSQLLKDAKVIKLPQWRFIQHLADIRNLCDHAKGKEPTKDEVEDLVSGTRKTLKTIF